MSQSGAQAASTLPPLATAIYLVDWAVLSEDGHRSAGEYAFAVGPDHGHLPTATRASSETSILGSAAAGTFLIGLGLALGGLVSERFVWLPAVGDRRSVPRARAGSALVLALVGATLELVALPSDTGTGTFTSSAWRSAFASRAGLVVIIVACALIYAGWLLFVERVRGIRRARTLAMVPLVGAALTAGFGGHSASTGPWWATVANAIHILLALAWVGALVHLVTVLWRLRSSERGSLLGQAASRYAGLALGALLPLLLAGTITALARLNRLADLWASDCGRTLLAQLGLVAITVAVALVARLRALGPPAPNLRRLRSLTCLEALTLAFVVVASGVLASTSPPPPAGANTSSELLGPPPIVGPFVRVADLAGNLDVFVSATADQLRVEIVAPSEAPAQVRHIEVERVEPDGSDTALVPRRCGTGCYTQHVAWSAATTPIRVSVEASGWEGGVVTLPVDWPPGPDATTEVSDTVAMMRRLPTIDITERVSSGPHASPPASAISLTGDQFIAGEPYAGGGFVDTRALPPAGGLDRITFFLPGAHMWQ